MPWHHLETATLAARGSVPHQRVAETGSGMEKGGGGGGSNKMNETGERKSLESNVWFSQVNEIFFSPVQPTGVIPLQD